MTELAIAPSQLTAPKSHYLSSFSVFLPPLCLPQPAVSQCTCVRPLAFPTASDSIILKFHMNLALLIVIYYPLHHCMAVHVGIGNKIVGCLTYFSCHIFSWRVKDFYSPLSFFDFCGNIISKFKISSHSVLILLI